jgi:hypothetical protein
MQKEEEEAVVVVKYDPFILKLIYSKVYYLDHLITIYLTWLAPSSMSHTNGITKRDNDTKLMRFLIEHEYHVKLVNRDVDQLERQLNDEKNAKSVGLFKFDLFYANFEFCLYRLWLIHHYTQKTSSGGSGGSVFNALRTDYIEDNQFCCELVMSSYVNNMFTDRERLVYQSLIERYIKDFYFDPHGFDFKRVNSRINQFLTTKVAVENALFKKHYTGSTTDNVIIYHTKESMMAIMLIYFTIEFIHYLHQDTRYSLVSKCEPSNVDYYNKETGLATNSVEEKTGNDNSDIIAVLERLKAEILDTCITRLYMNVDVSPNYDMSSTLIKDENEATTVISSFMNYFKKDNGSGGVYQSMDREGGHSKLIIEDHDDNDSVDVANILIDYENEFDKESYYHSYRKSASIFSSRRKKEKTKKDDTKPVITKNDQRQYNRFILKHDGKHEIKYLSIGKDAKSNAYYENITRVFLFDVRLSKNHNCRKNNYALKKVSASRSSPIPSSSSSSSLSGPIFHCSLCRYEYTHANYKDFYDHMNTLSYHKKLPSPSTQLSKTVLYRKDLSKRLALINIDMVERREAFIYKILHMSYLIPYHTSIVSKEYMKNLAIVSSPTVIPTSSTIGVGGDYGSGGGDPYTVLSLYENFFAFTNIDACIIDLQKGLTHKKTQQRMERILKECQSINLSSQIMAFGPIQFENDDGDDDNATVAFTFKPTHVMCQLATEILLLVLLMQAITNQHLKIEKRDSIKHITHGLLDSHTVKRNDDIIKCLNTVYCYYMYTLGLIVQRESSAINKDSLF